MSSITPITCKRVRLAQPPCTLGITNGSERGDYVPEPGMFNAIGRPHHVVNLMFQYYPDLEGWPTQGVKWHGFYRNNDLNLGDGYFPLVLEEGGKWGQFYLRQIEDVRAHGQDPQLTLTLHANTPDEDLIRIAKSLAPYGKMRIRINHECNGVWFYFNQKWSYKEVSDFFIRFHNILHEHAPEIQTVACWNGKGEAYLEPEGKAGSGGRLTEDQLAPMFRTADIISYDQYASLQYGWPNPEFDPENPTEYFKVPFEVWWDLLVEVHDQMCELKGGDVNIEIHEINEDANLIGFDGQAEWVRRFYEEAIKRNYAWLTNITFYMFRDRGGLGLEQEDVNEPTKFTQLPSLATYKDVTNHPHFELRMEETDVEDLVLRWTTTVDATGLSLTYDIRADAQDVHLVLPENGHFLIEANGHWTMKKAGETMVTLQTGGKNQLKVRIFAPPADGKNNVNGAYETALDAQPAIVVEVPANAI